MPTASPSGTGASAAQAASEGLLDTAWPERRWTESALRESEERYQILVEHSPDAIEVQGDGRFLYVSPAAMCLYGARSPRELIGTPVLDRVHPGDRRLVQARLRQMLELGALAPPQELRILRLDGEVVVVEATGAPIAYQGRPAVQMVLRDVTERRRSQAALEESERRFAAFLNSSCALAWMKDEQCRYVYINEPFARVFQIQAEEIDGKDDFGLWPEATARVTREHDEQVLASGKSFDTTELIPTPDGQPHHWWVFKFPFRDAAGRRFVAGMAVDITERMRLEEQLRQSQKLEGIGRLAGGIAHDFNNLLQVLSGYAELLRDHLEPDAMAKSSVEEIVKGCERAAGLTHQLLAYSRRQVLQPRVLDLNAAIRELTKLLGRLIGEPLQLVSHLDNSLRPIKADPAQIQQVIVNLAINARDAMPTGGQLVITTGNVDLDEAATDKLAGLAPGRYVLLAVSDSGQGMSAEAQEHLFEPFFTTKEIGKGTGLGLSVVYGIVKQSGGDIQVDTAPGRGTTFRIYLPAVDAAVDAHAAVAPAARPRGKETVLLVEDDNSVRGLLRLILQTHGYQVMEAAHGIDALRVSQRCADATIDLLVTDLVMPQMGGRELAEQLTARRPELKVLYLSGYTDDVAFRRSIQEADAPFLRKPFDTDSFLIAVRQVLDAATKN